MPRPPQLFLRAFAAGAAVAMLAMLAGPAAYADPGADARPAASAGQVRAAAAHADVEDQTPLQVQVSTLSVSEIPERGPIRVTGVVTNRSDERWTGINVHAFLDDTPITTPEELDQAAELPETAVVGSRITAPGMFDTIGGLDSGQSAPFSIRLRHSVLTVSEPGVYWFGVHALGQSASQPSDAVADGRARTFLPFVPAPAEPTRKGRKRGAQRSAQRSAQPPPSVDVALVVPVRHRIDRAPDGSVARAGSWAHALSPGGSLAAATEIGRAAGGRPLTWLVDPAVPDAVRRLVAGNPGRNLADTVPSGQTQDPAPTDEPSGKPTTEPTPAPLPKGPRTQNPAIGPGKAWLDGLKTVLGSGEVLALPYGDLDVSAAAFHAPTLLDLARRHSGDRLTDLDTMTQPAVVGASGYLDPQALSDLPAGETVIVGSGMVSGTRAAELSSISVDGRSLVVTSTPTAQGGPGPDDPRTGLAMRQRILAAAAVRLLSEPEQPLVVVLPQGWSPADLNVVFSGLDVPWLHLTTLDGAMSGDAAPRDVPADRLSYPGSVAAQALPADNFTAAQRLLNAGSRLENILTRNDRLGNETVDEALTDLSVQSRATRDRTRVRTDAAAAWLEHRLRGIKVSAPKGVTLSSSSGTFAAILRNRLDHPVTVSLEVRTDSGLRVAQPGLFDLAAQGRRTVVLDADVRSVGVHYVQLSVTDKDGAPLGSTARVPVRSTQYGKVIWVITGVGLGLLLLAWVRQRTRPKGSAGE